VSEAPKNMVRRIEEAYGGGGFLHAAGDGQFVDAWAPEGRMRQLGFLRHEATGGRTLRGGSCV
jgi:hypothetical protein